MRWFVEISPLGKGKGPTTKLCVEASQWQPALQKARQLRGDDAALSNFSIELLDDGYRAIDPAARLRYIVKKAPDDAVLSNGEAPRPVSIPPPPSSKRRPEMQPISIPPPANEGAAAQKGAEPARKKSGATAIPSDKVPPPPQAPSVPPFKQVSSREEEPSSRSPLTYREAVYTVAPGTPADRAEELIRDRFKEVRGALATRKAGKLVNLAVFDHAFSGRPQHPPLVTLTWKDWKGSEPEIRFPLRDGPGNTPTPLAPQIARTPPAPPAAPPATPEPEKAAPPPAKVEAPPPAKAEAPAPAKAAPAPAKVETAPAPAKKIEAAPAPVKFEAPVAAKAAPAEVAAPSAKATPAKVETPASAKSTPSKKAVVPTPPSDEVDIVDTADAANFEPKPASIPPAPTSQRRTGDDLIAELFEACSDLHFLQNPLDGADFVLALTLEKLPSEVGLVSLFDLNKREFVVVRQAGGSDTAVLARIPERSPLAHTAMRSKHTVVIADTATDRQVVDDERWKATGIKPTSVVCVPVELNGRYLGLIELANPLDGHHFSPSDGHALTYIGQQYAEFVASHGFVIDPEVVTQGPKKGRLR